jgi:hypothetical protein
MMHTGFSRVKTNFDIILNSRARATNEISELGLAYACCKFFC